MLLAATVGVLVWVTFTAETPIDRVVPRPALRVGRHRGAVELDVPLRQRHRGHCGLHLGSAGRRVVPAGEEVEFDATSRDVIHGFWVPRLHYLRQVRARATRPGSTSSSRTPGRYEGECAVYCGELHSQMHFAIEAVAPAQFRALAREPREGPVSVAAPLCVRRRLRGLASTDHKRIALNLGVVAFVFFIAGGVLALIMRTQLAADGGVVSENAYNQLFTMHGSTMVYLFVVPIALAAGLYLVPLQVGAADVAAPRLALAGLWLLVCGGITMWCGFLTSGGAAQASWWGFDPLSDLPHSPGSGMDLWLYGVVLATVAEMLWAGCIVATVVRRRAPRHDAAAHAGLHAGRWSSPA